MNGNDKGMNDSMKLKIKIAQVRAVMRYAKKLGKDKEINGGVINVINESVINESAKGKVNDNGTTGNKKASTGEKEVTGKANSNEKLEFRKAVGNEATGAIKREKESCDGERESEKERESDKDKNKNKTNGPHKANDPPKKDDQSNSEASNDEGSSLFGGEMNDHRKVPSRNKLGESKLAVSSDRESEARNGLESNARNDLESDARNDLESVPGSLNDNTPGRSPSPLNNNTSPLNKQTSSPLNTSNKQTPSPSNTSNKQTPSTSPSDNSHEIIKFVKNNRKCLINVMINEMEKGGKFQDYGDLMEYFSNRIKKRGEETEESLYQQGITEDILMIMSKGDLVSDKRFYKMLEQTIKQMKTYEDEQTNKMSVLFVLCKNYVADYIEVKKRLNV